MGSGEGTTGHEVVSPVRERREDIRTRSNDPIGGRFRLAIRPARSNRNDAGLIGGKPWVRSVFTGVCGDYEDTFIARRPNKPSDQRIVRTGQAQIDDRDAKTHSLIERRQERKAVAYCRNGTEALRPTRLKRVDFGIGRNSDNADSISAASGDDAGDRRPVDIIGRFVVI